MNEHSGHSILNEKRIGPVKEPRKNKCFRRKDTLGRGEDQQSNFSEIKGRESMSVEFPRNMVLGKSMLFRGER